ncbi:MAG: DUF1801 domain-containing protein [Bryobacteraceae bacterium]|nr:DUF1801 domain-containing protein [Bryobacteraceae bacterium]
MIDERIRQLGDWRGKTLAKVREIIHAADPQIVEEWKWMGTPVWSHGDIVCTGETYKDGNVRRTIDIHEIKYVHVADSNRLAPGWRHLPLEDLLRVLADLGCDGYVTAEIPAQARSGKRRSAGGGLPPGLSAPARVHVPAVAGRN